MIYVFIPYYNEDTPEFKKSLGSQTYKDYRVVRYDRKKHKALWTKAVNWFWRECQRYCGTSWDDIILIINNDIEFAPDFFEDIAKRLKKTDVYIAEGGYIDWETKSFEIRNAYQHDYWAINTFIGHSFAMFLGNFRRFGKLCSLLPHALADIDYGLKVLRYQKPIYNWAEWRHPDHDYESCSIWSLRSYKNPILWTIFLLKHLNRYTFINILKSWYEVIRLFRKS